MSTRSAMLSLPGGIEIAFDEYGDPAGTPVIFCHGWPSSRSMAQLTHNAACALGVRVISPDRPGINESTYIADRELLQWPAIVEALARHLSLGKIRLLGISGGAPYAFATAWALPDSVAAVAIVSGAPPIAELNNHAGLLRLHRWMLAFYAKRPQLLRALFGLARPFASIRPPLRFRPMMLRLLQPCDADVLRDTAAFEACFESARRAWRGSARGVISDAEVYARPWGFPLEEITTPVQLWHGTKDRTFSFRLAEEVAARLPECELQLVEGAGHYSLPIRHMDEILAKLCAS